MTNFEEVLTLHLQSIKDRSISKFSEFLHPSEKSMVILPNGSMIEGYENIIDFHKSWFEDTDWRMDTTIVDIFATNNMGYALLDVTYQDLNEEGQPYEMKYFLSLLFKKTNDKWILLRDQNTLK